VKELQELISSMSPESLIQIEISRLLLENQVSLDAGHTMRGFLVSCIQKKLPGVEAEKLSIYDIQAKTGMELGIFVTHLDSSALQRASEDENVIDALCASMAIPPLLPPVKLKTGYCADGGILNNFPLSAFPPSTLGLNLLQRKHNVQSVLASPTPFFAYMITILEIMLTF
jgi:predicted acylesterase/phospholipase RssA